MPVHCQIYKAKDEVCADQCSLQDLLKNAGIQSPFSTGIVGRLSRNPKTIPLAPTARIKVKSESSAQCFHPPENLTTPNLGKGL